MKRGDIIAALREAQADRANAQAWQESCDEKIIALINLLEAPAERPAVPSQVEYDRERFDEPPRPVQPNLDAVPGPLCKCGDPAKRIEKEGRNGKPYVAYACPNPKAEGCDFWVFENQLQRT